jgi:2-phospho-L-lactate guanylyltransferase
MNTWAIVPVKPFVQAKSRLAGVLSPDERAGLSRDFLGHALQVLDGVPEVARVLVVSRDPAALTLARNLGSETLAEAGTPGLNPALERAAQLAKASGASAVMVLPTDLPLLTADELRCLLTTDDDGSQIAIAPDRHGAGTNALWMRPPGLISFAFGPGSLQRHQILAETAGATVRVCRLPGLSLDVDEPEDLALFRAGQLAQ